MPSGAWNLAGHVGFALSRNPELDLTAALNIAFDFASRTEIKSHVQFAEAFLREFVGLLLQKAVVVYHEPEQRAIRSAISEADAFKVAHTHGRDGLDKVIEALRAFKVAVSPELDRRARSDWESALARMERHQEDMSNLRSLLMLGRQLCPRLCSLPLPVQPEYASPHVYTHLKVLQAALSGSSVSDNVRIAASSVGILTALQRSASASGFSKLAQLLADARSQASSSTASISSTSASSSATEYISMKELLANPIYATGFRNDAGCVAQYCRRFIPDLPLAWTVVQHGAPVYVSHVLECLYPKLGQANIKRIVQTLSVNGEHALCDLFMLALHEPNVFYWLQCDLHFYVGPRYFGDVLELANELSVDNIEKYRASIVASLVRSGHAYTELRLGTLFYYVRQSHPSANYHSLLEMCLFLCSKPELQSILSLGRADDRHFYDTLSDIIRANALRLKSMVELDTTAAMLFLDTDVRGVLGDKGAGIKCVDRPVGPQGVYFAANPNSGKTQVGAMVLRDLADSGFNFGVVIAATNADKGEISKRLENFGFEVVFPELNPDCMGKPYASRLDMLSSFIDRSRPTVVVTTIHSLPALLWSKNAMDSATEEFERKHDLGAVPLSKLFNLPAIWGDIAFSYVGECQGVLSALGSDLIVNKNLAMHALACLCGGVQFNIFDGAVDVVSFLFAKDVCHNVQFHVHVPPDVPRKVRTMTDARLFLSAMEEQLRNPAPLIVITDSASMVPVVAAAIHTVDASRTVVTMTAEHQDVPFSELNAALNAGADVVGSPYIGLGLDLTADVHNVFLIVFGHSAPGPVLDQMTERARKCKTLHVLFANNWAGPLRLTRAPAETKLGLCRSIMEVLFDPNLRGGFMPTLADGVPSDLDEVLRVNQAGFYTRNLQDFLAGSLQKWLFVGMDRHVPRNLSEAQLAQVVLHVEPGTRHALVAYCRCDVKHVDSTFDGAACRTCGTIPLVFPAGYMRCNWLRRPPHDLGKNADFMQGECWQYCEQPDEMPMLPVLSPVAMDSIRQLLQTGDQSEYRRALYLLSRFLSKGYTVEYAEAPQDGVTLSAGMMAVAEAIRAGGTQDAITTAILGLGDDKEKVGLPRNELLRAMLGAGNPDDREAACKIVRTQAFLTTLGISPSLEVVDRLAMATGLAWNARFPGWGLKKKLHWFRQLVVLAGYPDYLAQWMRSVLYVYEGSEPPASGIGGADELLNHMATVRFSRLAVLLREIEGKGSQTPLILDLNGLAFPGIDVNRPVVELVSNRDECVPILSAITGGSAAFGLYSGALADVRAMSLMDTIRLLKKLSKRLWGMSLKWRRKEQTLQWQRPHLATRLCILHFRLVRDPPAHSPDARAFLQKTVRDALMGVDVTEVPLFDIADIRKPSPTLARTMTAGSLPSTAPYDDGFQSQPDVPISRKEMEVLLAYMQPAIAKKPELAHFGTTRHLEDLWARLTLDERALVLGGSSGATRAHLQLKLNLGKLALEIMEAQANPTSVIGQTINKMRQAGRLDTLNSLSEAASQENAFRACDAVSEPSESDTEEEEDDEPQRKRCKFLDDEAGQDDREENDLVSSSVDTQTYD